MGLAWDITDGKEVDLDASCLFLDDKFAQIDCVWLVQKNSNDGAMVHTGDNMKGDGSGDDESITVNLLLMFV